MFPHRAQASSARVKSDAGKSVEQEQHKGSFLTRTLTGLYGEEYLEGAHLVENVGTSNEQHYDLLLTASSLP